MSHEGMIDGVVLRPLAMHEDPRGWLIELLRDDELPPEHRPAMSYLSMSLPGVTRGPHEHREQSDYFVFVGPGDFQLDLWDARRDSPTYQVRQTLVVGQSNRQAVLIPPRVVHAYTNISLAPGLVLNFPNRLFRGWGRSEPVDETRYEDQPDNPYVVE